MYKKVSFIPFRINGLIYFVKLFSTSAWARGVLYSRLKYSFMGIIKTYICNDIMLTFGIKFLLRVKNFNLVENVWEESGLHNF